VPKGDAEDAMEGVVGPAAEMSVVLPCEDKAVEAVRQAMEAFALL
jgi:hypothetical protein